MHFLGTFCLVCQTPHPGETVSLAVPVYAHQKHLLCLAKGPSRGSLSNTRNVQAVSVLLQSNDIEKTWSHSLPIIKGWWKPSQSTLPKYQHRCPPPPGSNEVPFPFLTRWYQCRPRGSQGLGYWSVTTGLPRVSVQWRPCGNKGTPSFNCRWY